MKRRLPIWCGLILGLSLVVGACEEDKRAPPVPVGGGATGTMSGSIKSGSSSGGNDSSAAGRGSVLTSAPDSGSAGGGFISGSAGIPGASGAAGSSGGAIPTPSDFLDSGVR